MKSRRKLTLEQAMDGAKRASKMNESTWFVIKVRGGFYDYCEKGITTPTYAQIVNGYTTGIIENIQTSEWYGAPSF